VFSTVGTSPSVNRNYPRDNHGAPYFQQNPLFSRGLEVVESGVMERIYRGLQQICNKFNLKIRTLFSHQKLESVLFILPFMSDSPSSTERNLKK